MWPKPVALGPSLGDQVAGVFGPRPSDVDVVYPLGAEVTLLRRDDQPVGSSMFMKEHFSVQPQRHDYAGICHLCHRQGHGVVP